MGDWVTSTKAFEEQWTAIKHILINHLDMDIVEFTVHAKERMIERDIEQETVSAILRYGKLTEMFKPWEYPYGENPYNNRSPVFALVGLHRGEQYTVGMAINLLRDTYGISAEFSVLTVFPVSEKSRHRLR